MNEDRITTTALTSWESLIESEWNLLVRSRSPFESHSWLSQTPTHGSISTVVAHNKGVLCGGLPLWIFGPDENPYHLPSEILLGSISDRLSQISDSATYQLSGPNWFPSIVALSPFGYCGGLIQPEWNERVASLILDRTRVIASELHSSFVAHMYLDPSNDADWIQHLISGGGLPVVLGVRSVLPVEWSSLDAYFRWLGQSRRGIRQDFNQSLRDGFVPAAHWASSGEEFASPVHEEAQILLKGTAADRNQEANPSDLIGACMGAWPERRLLITFSRAGKVVSALLSFTRGNRLYPKFFGSQARDGSYFQLTFPLLIDSAINEGITLIDYGGSSHNAKLHRGAQPVWILGVLDPQRPDVRNQLVDILADRQAIATNYFLDLCRKHSLGHVAMVAPPRH